MDGKDGKDGQDGKGGDGGNGGQRVAAGLRGVLRSTGSALSVFSACCVYSALSALSALSACSPRSPTSASITLVDDAGDSVRLVRAATRVVSLIPTTTEVLFAIGAGTQVVGRTTWCDWPPAALAVPSLGDGIEPNVELVVAAQPELVVLYRSSRNAFAAHRLRELGVPTVQLRTDLLEDLERATALLGAATGHESEAREAIDRLRRELAAVRRATGDGPRILVLAWDQPPMAIGAGSFLHQVVEMAGGRNLFGDLAVSAGPVSLEAIAARDPDVILTTSEAPAFLTRPEWRVVRAVREHRLVRVRGTEFARPTPRAAEAVRRLAAALDALETR